MSTKSEVIGKRLINGIDGMEASAVNGLHAGANGARELTRTSSRWASQQETNATRKAHLLKRRLERQTAQLTKAAGKSVDSAVATARKAAVTSDRYVRKNPWQTVAVTSAAALLAGVLLGRRGR